MVQQLPDREEIAKALGHLLALDLEHLVVHPDACEAVAHAAGLGDFVLVVREDEVIAAAVDVEAFAQKGGGHG